MKVGSYGRWTGFCDLFPLILGKNVSIYAHTCIVRRETFVAENYFLIRQSLSPYAAVYIRKKHVVPLKLAWVDSSGERYFLNEFVVLITIICPGTYLPTNNIYK